MLPARPECSNLPDECAILDRAGLSARLASSSDQAARAAQPHRGEGAGQLPTAGRAEMTTEPNGGLPGRIGRATGRLALRPVRAVAEAGRGAVTDEAGRAIDGGLAGALPGARGRSPGR